MLRWLVSLLAVSAAVGCRRAAPKPGLPELAAQINAAIPAAWKGKVTLEPWTVDSNGHRYALLLPKGWKLSPVHEGTVVPADNNQLDDSEVFGSGNEVSVMSYCAGDCSPGRDWYKASDDQIFAQFRDMRVRGTVLSDERQPNGRLLITQREPEKGTDVKVTAQDKSRIVVRAWWDKNGSSYHVCQVVLSDVSYELAPAMAAACMTATATPLPGAASK
ncbi:MAG TPA: hypothetical protein PKU97_25385 [Kofleriaceae bacterium]|nr:hypothetical protein [Kofleriaceae bacterium]